MCIESNNSAMDRAVYVLDIYEIITCMESNNLATDRADIVTLEYQIVTSLR